MLVLARLHTVEPVVGAHNGVCAAVADGFAEGLDIDLFQGAFVDVNIDARRPVAVAAAVSDAFGFLVVGDKVLDRLDGVCGLGAQDGGAGHATGEYGIFAEGFRLAAGVR
ncbi:hypothetical protein D9M72_470950 [compost metagenome]